MRQCSNQRTPAPPSRYRAATDRASPRQLHRPTRSSAASVLCRNSQKAIHPDADHLLLLAHQTGDAPALALLVSYAPLLSAGTAADTAGAPAPAESHSCYAVYLVLAAADALAQRSDALDTVVAAEPHLFGLAFALQLLPTNQATLPACACPSPYSCFAELAALLPLPVGYRAGSLHKQRWSSGAAAAVAALEMAAASS